MPEASVESDVPLNVASSSAPEGGANGISDGDLFKMQDNMLAVEKKKRGRPPGSKNSPKQNETQPDTVQKLFNGANSLTNQSRQQKQPSTMVLDSKEIQKPTEEVSTKEQEFSDTPIFDPSLVFGDDNVEQKKEEPKISEPEDVDKETNIKNLRHLVKNFKSEKENLSKELETLRAKISSSPDVSGLQTELTKLKDRVSQLEPYEMVFALHNNPDFKAKYVDGIQSVIGEMRKIAMDYGVDDSVIDDIIATENRKDLDELLSDNFSSIGAQSDLKILRQKVDGLYRERKEFEKRPQDALASFEARRLEKEAEEEKQRGAIFEKMLNEGWSSALSSAAELPQQQKIYELVEIPGKKEHNEKVVRPTLQAAENMLKAGLSHVEKMIRNKAVVDRGFATWLATLCQQAAAAQMLNYTRGALYEQFKKQKTQSEKERSVERPSLNGAPRSPSVSGQKSDKKMSGKDRAAEIFFSVQKDMQE